MALFLMDPLHFQSNERSQSRRVGWEQSCGYCLWWCQGVSLQQRAELDTAQYPVNQWIVVGEPVVSQHCNTACLQRSYIECDGLLVAWRKAEQKVNSGADDGVCGAVEKSEGDWIDLVGAELMFEDGSGIQETVGWSRIYEGADVSGQKEVGVQGNHEGIQVVKSGGI